MGEGWVERVEDALNALEQRFKGHAAWSVLHKSVQLTVDLLKHVSTHTTLPSLPYKKLTIQTQLTADQWNILNVLLNVIKMMEKLINNVYNNVKIKREGY